MQGVYERNTNGLLISSDNKSIYHVNMLQQNLLFEAELH
ncbi:MAG: hypothetical protein SCABRO_02313 [Candidatus Scalindua brodae]|uniref:Uncharacterized protein n=1 Tax=Candidatus Scalindua brodae TaxID=237368 RepID=A0A0B0EHA2_9BACT|nr:MAG: hypothetical protein SCABRO_02313 [Candidatus Scalindua brodae]